MKVLVTGGGGFLGGAIVRQLLAEGQTVRSFGRKAQPELEKLGVEVVQGDLANAAAVSAAAKGCDAIIHTAAKAGVWGPREEYFMANVLGARNVVGACRAHGIRLLVYTSTPSVVFNGESLEGADESLPYGTRFLCHYAETKAQAERETLQAHDPDKLRICALRPHLIWGVGDPHLLPRVLERARAGRLANIGDGTNRVDITHVENAAAAHLQALRALADGPAGGKAYFLSQGEPVELWPWINDFLQRMDVAPLRRQLSLKTAYRIGAVAEKAWLALRLRGEPPMTRFVAVELAKSHWFDISAARRDLGYRPLVTTEAGLEAYVEHLRKTDQR